MGMQTREPWASGAGGRGRPEQGAVGVRSRGAVGVRSGALWASGAGGRGCAEQGRPDAAWEDRVSSTLFN